MNFLLPQASHLGGVRLTCGGQHHLLAMFDITVQLYETRGNSNVVRRSSSLQTRGQQTFSLKGQNVRILGSLGYVSCTASTLSVTVV